MKLEEVLNRIPVLEIIGNKNRAISEIIFDSRKAVENALYVAITGTVSDGHAFINSSIEYKLFTGIIALLFSSSVACNEIDNVHCNSSLAKS